MREIERLLNKDTSDGTDLDETQVQRIYYILRAQGGVHGAELATALDSQYVPEQPEPPPEPPPEG